MIDFFNKYRSNLLDLNEENFSVISKTIDLLHSILKQKYNFSGTRFVNKDGHSGHTESQIPDFGRDRSIVLNEVTNAFENMIRWHHPYVMHNITPPPLLDTVSVRTLANVYNPNLLWDFVSGSLLYYEETISKQLAALLGWDESTTLGLSTFGGKSTLIYAIKMGMNLCAPSSINDGVGNQKVVVITSESGHYSIEYVCNLVGLGKNNCLRIPNDKNGKMDIHIFKETVSKCLAKGQKIGAIILAGGNSLNNTIDPILEIRNIIEDMVKLYSLDYKPHLHVDSVIGWAWLFYKDYDYNSNEIGISENVLVKIKDIANEISEIQHADSAGVDFHKSGLCPYVTSFFVTKNAIGLHSMNSADIPPNLTQEYGKRFVQHYSIEHTRGGEGVLSAWVALQELGVDGFRRYIAQMMTINHTLRSKINLQEFEILNPEGKGFAIIIFPKMTSITNSYVNLLEADNETVARVRNYCYEFFRYTSHDSSHRDKKGLVIGYVLDYQKNASGTDIPALKLYPMYPFTTSVDIEHVSTQLTKLKKEFDHSFIQTVTNKATITDDVIYPK